MAQLPDAEPRFCRLEEAQGRKEICPAAACPFWEPGGVVLEPRCAIDELDLTGRPDLAAWLLKVRRMLEAAQTAEQKHGARRLYASLLESADS